MEWTRVELGLHADAVFLGQKYGYDIWFSPRQALIFLFYDGSHGRYELTLNGRYMFNGVPDRTVKAARWARRAARQHVQENVPEAEPALAVRSSGRFTPSGLCRHYRFVAGVGDYDLWHGHGVMRFYTNARECLSCYDEQLLPNSDRRTIPLDVWIFACRWRMNRETA